jgi:hypothetical protein
MCFLQVTETEDEVWSTQRPIHVLCSILENNFGIHDTEHKCN